MTAPTVTILAGRLDGDGWQFDEVPEAPTDPIVAASGPSRYPVEPPREWFDDPKLDGPTMITIEPSGRVYGHVCDWSSRHIGLPGHVAPPKSKTGYAHFLSGNTLCADGSTIRTGHLTLGTGHASLEAGAQAAANHYDQTGATWADVSAGSDQFGWWVAGSLRPDVTPEQVRAARGSSLSGDWRDVAGNGQLEPVAALSVNCPGYGIPQPLARVASGAPTAIVAAGVLDPSTIRIVLNRTPDPAEEATPMSEKPDTPEVTDAVTAAAPAPFPPKKDTPPAPAPTGGDIAEGSVVTATGDLPPGEVQSVDGDEATVIFIVPVDALEDAGDGGKKAMLASARERLTQRELNDMRAAKAAADEQMSTMAASLDALTASVQGMKAKEDDREDQALLASIPAKDGQGNG